MRYFFLIPSSQTANPPARKRLEIKKKKKKETPLCIFITSLPWNRLCRLAEVQPAQHSSRGKSINMYKCHINYRCLKAAENAKRWQLRLCAHSLSPWCLLIFCFVWFCFAEIKKKYIYMYAKSNLSDKVRDHHWLRVPFEKWGQVKVNNYIKSLPRWCILLWHIHLSVLWSEMFPLW